MKRVLSGLVCLLGLFAASTDIVAQTVISCPGPVTISARGSYKLGSNCGTLSDGIIITVNNVTVDLNGYPVFSSAPVVCTPAAQGNSCTGTGTQAGIRITGNYVTIKNGEIFGFNGDGIHVTQSSTSGTGIILQNLQVHDNNAFGIYAGITSTAAAQAVMTDVVADYNGSVGILAVGAIASRVSALGNNLQGVNITGTVADSYAGNNLTTGILSNSGSIENSVALGNGVGIGFNGAVTNSVAASNTGAGGFTSGSGVIANSASYFNVGPGFNLGSSTCYISLETYGNSSTVSGGTALTGTSPDCLY
jgi:hypothetical protein